MTEKSDFVHYVDYASQPYVRLACTGEEHYVAHKQPRQAEKVYQSDGGLYTFEAPKVTCPSCIGYLKGWRAGQLAMAREALEVFGQSRHARWLRQRIVRLEATSPTDEDEGGGDGTAKG